LLGINYNKYENGGINMIYLSYQSHHLVLNRSHDQAHYKTFLAQDPTVLDMPLIFSQTKNASQSFSQRNDI
jgi:hypothetical protein